LYWLATTYTLNFGIGHRKAKSGTRDIGLELEEQIVCIYVIAKIIVEAKRYENSKSKTCESRK
jgi:hypothetical protein